MYIYSKCLQLKLLTCLQEYIDLTNNSTSSSGSELGRSVALEMARVAPAGSRQSQLHLLTFALPMLHMHPELTRLYEHSVLAQLGWMAT